MNNIKNILALVGLLAIPASAFSQERPSSSIFLSPFAKADVSLNFDVKAEGKRFSPVWGLDVAWINEQNVRKGLRHMGKENVGVGRSAFRFTHALTNDSVLDAEIISWMKTRNNVLDIISTTLPILFTADQEAGANTYFVVNKSANVAHWAANINSHVHWMQANTKHPVLGVSPFNEPDYWTVEEGATTEKQSQVAKLLKESYPRFADIAIVGANTLNNDKALEWYNAGKTYFDWGNTHQLAGSMANYINFYKKLQSDGKVGLADEMHNVGDAIIGLENGMTYGIWWGFDSRSRGEFCDISRHGQRLAYANHPDKWTSAAVYKHDDGRVKAFIGSSERQAFTTNYQFVSLDRAVYYDGHGPLREFVMEIPGGTKYQEGQTNAERVIDVTWGEDVQPDVIDGVYQIVNKATGQSISFSSTTVFLQKTEGKRTQQWKVTPCNPRIGGDYSFYAIEADARANLRLNVRDFSTFNDAEVIGYNVNTSPDSNEQWYLQYAGNGYFYIRCRESSLCLSAVTSSTKLVTKEMITGNEADIMLWRILPPQVKYDTEAPAVPQGLLAENMPAAVRLSWTANEESDVDSYMILRAEKGSNDWNTVGRKVKGTTFVDNTCQQGKDYLYKIRAIDAAANLSGASESIEAKPTGEATLVGRWHLDGNLLDMSPHMMDAAYYGNPNYSDEHKSGTQSLILSNSTGGYLQLPYEVANSEELTVAMWVNMLVNSQWQRLFDFGYDTDHYMFFTPNNGNRQLCFGIKNGGDELTVTADQTLSLQKWCHVAVTIGKNKTAIYVDGKEVASSTGITIRPTDIHPLLNYIGRSQFPSDPIFNGKIDDIRRYFR